MFPSSTSHKRRSACLIELSNGQKPGNILALPHGVSPPNNYWGYPLVPHDDSQLEHKVENQLVVMMGRRTRKKNSREKLRKLESNFQGCVVHSGSEVKNVVKSIGKWFSSVGVVSPVAKGWCSGEVFHDFFLFVFFSFNTSYRVFPWDACVSPWGVALQSIISAFQYSFEHIFLVFTSASWGVFVRTILWRLFSQLLSPHTYSQG